MNTYPKHILISRFSAMGDVVLTVPVIKNLLIKHPDLKIYVLSKPFFKPFFEAIPQVTFIEADLKGQHKGLKGLRLLAKQITDNYPIDAVFDLHSVMRTWLLNDLFKRKGIPVFKIDKGRKAKKQFVKRKQRQSLKHTTERYSEVFKIAGFELADDQQYILQTNADSTSIKIGIAPFAGHNSKQWGVAKIYELIDRINLKYNVEFLLFGGGAKEIGQLNKIVRHYNNVTNIAGTISLTEEIELISQLSALVCMDSGNMHIATLTGIPVISIWGGTHPDIGFKALYQPDENSIQAPVETLPCRPCSVYGTKNCQLKAQPFACMEQVEAKTVVKRLEELEIL